jgi:DNA-binding IclR family transcriptional regulator
MTDSSVGTLARGLDVLELFASSRPLLSQKEISDALALPMPTVHRLTALLTERGWLERDRDTRRLRLGLEMTRLVPALLAGMDLPELARRHLAALAADVDESVNLAILQGAEIVYLLSEAGDRVLTSRVPAGTRLPAHCTALGKCLLAQLPEAQARAALGPEPYRRLTAHTRTSWRSLRADLASARAGGQASSEEEYELGLVSIAVPVRWIDGPGSAAINVSLPSGRALPEVREQITESLREAARALDRDAALGEGSA